MKAVKGKELILKVENKVGKLAEITKLIKDAGVNIRAVSAWVIGAEASLRLVTSDDAKAKSTLAALGSIDEKDVVIIDMPDEVGQLDNLALKLKDNNIDLNHIYGTTSEPGKSAVIIFSSNNNDKALEVISA